MVLTLDIVRQTLCRAPDAVARVSGAPGYPELRGEILFWQTRRGVLVLAQVSGLPPQGCGTCDQPVFAMHIHAGGSCTGTQEDPFSDTDGHFNPGGCEHPAHAGDLPPLFSNNGLAWNAVLTNRFTVRAVLGRTVIIHAGRDDFTTQPAGNAGAKIACGVIRAC